VKGKERKEEKRERRGVSFGMVLVIVRVRESKGEDEFW
jgi:hypothetical protein